MNSTDETVLTLLDISGSCITDIFYNHLYDRAIATHEKSGKGLTECYRQAISNYVKESNAPQFFTVILNSIHHYTRISTIHRSISYPDCITLYSGLFVPHMYVCSLTFDQKVNILSMVLGNVVRLFSEEIIQRHLTLIIDDHSDCVNVEILQDEILKLMLFERQQSYDRFIQSQKPNKPKKATKAPLTINTKAMSKLSDAFKKSISDRVVLRKKNKALVAQFEELKAMFLNQIVIQKAQASAINDLKKELVAAHKNTMATRSPTIEHEHENDDDLFSVQYVEN